MAATPERIAEWTKRVQEVNGEVDDLAGDDDEQYYALRRLEHAERMLNLLRRSLTSDEHRVLLGRLDALHAREKEHEAAVAAVYRDADVLKAERQAIEHLMRLEER